MRGMFGWLVVASLCVLFSNESMAAQWYVSGDVSGTWASGDTMIVEGEIRVPQGSTLRIEPGVQVLFEGRYAFVVEGRLEARGTRSNMIAFTRAYPTEQSKWRGFRFIHAETGSCLERCVIEYARGEGDYPEVRGGGIWIDHSSPAIRECRIMNNYSRNAESNGAGGGICVDQGSFPVIDGNYICNNQADSGGGIMVGSGSKPEVINNVIEENQAFYAGGGIYVASEAESVITANVIKNNHSEGWGGGGISLWSGTGLYGTYSTVCCNVICNNTATDAGGGIYSRYATSMLYNNTVARNQAERGGGIYVLTEMDYPPDLCNSIVWDNTASTGPQIHLDPEANSAMAVSFCNVMDGWSGSGNINADPLFVHPASSDYHLYYDSPCLDAGDSSPAVVPAHDFEGDPRNALDAPDMGADEFYTRLYATGDFTPGGQVWGRLVGLPGTNPVGLIIGTDVLDPPMHTHWGELYVSAPWAVVAPLGSIPAEGVMTLEASLPLSPPAPYSIPMQAMIGEELTPLVEMDIY
ncbi:MAG: right-handed parallel beta-helix repeat-containing protein [Planctomycetota bacterium]